MLKLLSKLFKKDKILDKNIRLKVRRILDLEKEYQNLEDGDIKIKTKFLREQVKNEEDLGRILPEAYLLFVKLQEEQLVNNIMKFS